MKISDGDLQELLSQAGLKNTSGRLALLRLLQAEGPLSHEEIMVKLAHISINRVTIYRALDSFVQAGIVHRMDSGDRVWRFALCGRRHSGHCHPHFVCKSCGKVECMEKMELPKVSSFFEGYSIEESELYLKGRCSECRKE